MPNTYVIADLHGRFDLLVKAYAAIERHAGGQGTIIHLGDYVDRGPQSRQVIEFLMDEKTILHGLRRIVLRGNHEEIMLVTCVNGIRPDWWISNGGGRTLISYGHPKEADEINVNVVPQEHLRWIADLPFTAEDQHRFYVHAGVLEGKPLEEQEAEILTWYIYPEHHPGFYNGKHVVHGHHQHADGPKSQPGRTDLDTMAWYTGRLAIGVFDDNQPGGPVEILWAEGDPDPRFRS